MFAGPRRLLSRRVESGSKPETLQHKYADNWLNDARLTDSGLTYRELVSEGRGYGDGFALKPNAARCSCQSIENGPSRSESCRVAGCVPFRMASTMSGASRESRMVRERYPTAATC
jgi:hypothetical protein